MKLPALTLLACLLFPVPIPRQEPPARKQDPLGLALPEKEGERLAREVQGSWLLFEYRGPAEAPMDDEAAGFATFQDGFLNWFLAIETYESRLFRSREAVLLQTGAYRYRFDEGGSLQVASVLAYHNMGEGGDVERESAGRVDEYTVHLSDGVLELRNSEGVQIAFRKVEAGTFPTAAIRKLEGRRGGVDSWEVEGEPPR